MQFLQPAITNLGQPVESLAKRAIAIILYEDRDRSEAGDYAEFVPGSVNLERSVINLKEI